MKVFVDECVDWRLARDIVGHEVKTARQMGWSTIKNGELLALAAGEFEVFVTVDRNLSFQQNLPAFAIAVIVLRATSNRLADLKGATGAAWPLRVTPPLRIEITDDARAQIAAAAAWWAENRLSAPGAIRKDLDRILCLLCVQPGMGTRARRAKLGYAA